MNNRYLIPTNTNNICKQNNNKFCINIKQVTEQLDETKTKSTTY